MIHNPYLILLVLLTIECFILFLSSHPKFKKYFDFLPPVFWIYFLPMLASTAGLIDPKAPIYQVITTNILPACLFILLMTVDVKAIIHLGPTAIFMFFAGSVGIILGAVITFSIFKSVIGPEFWAGFGALSGSWTGGSANMIAVKEALSTPDEVFLPMVVVDTIVPYVWMGFLVAIVSIQPLFDRWNKADRTILEELSLHSIKSQKSENTQFRQRRRNWIVPILALGAIASFCAQTISQFLPVIQNVISTYAWTIIVVTTIGIACSFTPLKKLEAQGSNKIGYFLLYFVLTTIGAKASLSDIGSSLILIVAGFCIVLIHAIVLLLAARLVRAPMFLVAAASQANIGGVASAPVVAEIYHQGLASVGLLLAILGNIVGTYLGIITAQLCRLLN